MSDDRVPNLTEWMRGLPGLERHWPVVRKDQMVICAFCDRTAAEMETEDCSRPIEPMYEPINGRAFLRDINFKPWKRES